MYETGEITTEIHNKIPCTFSVFSANVPNGTFILPSTATINLHGTQRSVNEQEISGLLC